MDKSEFVKKCGELLNIAKPNLASCEYRLGKDIELTETEKFIGHICIDADEYVIVSCQNGCWYILSITGNSLHAVAAEIFNSMANK